jgi:hypothetical protein
MYPFEKGEFRGFKNDGIGKEKIKIKKFLV